MTDVNPPRTPRKGKIVNLRVTFLDSSLYTFQIPVKAIGIVLWDAVVKHLQLLEADYFDLQFFDEKELKCWLDREKVILKQLPSPDTPLHFCVKFYTPDPALLEEEFTRYQFVLQIKHELCTGQLICSENTAALLASYIVQAEIGDFLEDEYLDFTYLSCLKLAPNQSDDMMKRIMEYHKKHIAQSPAEADINLLDTARKVEMYGIRMQTARDHEDVSLNLAIAHMGILVFQNLTKINTFSWAIVRKLSFKRKKFLIKLHPDSYGYYKDTVEFYFRSRDDCKMFWKKCIEHHAFFRCQTVKRYPRNKTRVVSRGSSFRYSGRTQKELVEYMRQSYLKRPGFERSSSSGRVSCRSTSVTPKISSKSRTLNSSDFHVSQNSTASSGSHVLEPANQDVSMNSVAGKLVEATDVHSESSLSGSRSLGSPKVNHHPADIVDSPADVAHEAPADWEDQEHVTTVPDSGDELEMDMSRLDPPPPPPPSLSLDTRDKPHIRNVVTSPSSLYQSDRKMSEPVLNSPLAHDSVFEQRLSRCDEVINIPETVDEDFPNSGGCDSPSRPRFFRNYSTGNHVDTTPNVLLQSTSTPVNVNINGRLDSIVLDPLPPAPHTPPIVEANDKEENDLDSPHKLPPLPHKLASGILSADISTVSTKSVSGLSNMSIRTEESGEEDSRRKFRRHPMDRAYYIAKELLMTERTYKKDLELLTIWFRKSMQKDDLMPEYLSHIIFSNLDLIYDFHCRILKEIDSRVSNWEGRSSGNLNREPQRIADILLSNLGMLELYSNYLEHQDEILFELELACKRSKAFEQAYRSFESQKVCYLPVNTFILKPGQRLLHYKLLMERLIKHYHVEHPDFQNCKAALASLSGVTSAFMESMKAVDNSQKLIELQRDLIGIESLANQDRQFIREGCLQKFSRKGYQQRMFFLFSDMLVYTSRTATPYLQFKVHGQLPLRGMIVEETDNSKMAVAHSFSIYGGNRCLLVAASSEEEKAKWIEDLNESIIIAKSKSDDKLQYASLKSSASSSENVDGTEQNDSDRILSTTSPEKPNHHRANTTMHVCWHRNTSVSMRDFERAVKNQLSGYLLRKFKNSNGWQKLWVVFTNFCLFFYKSYQDDFPLASLPLLGYAVSNASDQDGIHKDHVFKLQFKNHVYFFRAESEYTFERWTEVINSATSSAHRLRLFSRMESQHQS